MEVLRHHILTKCFTIVTAVAFLNMGFFLAEAVLLDFKDKKLVENIANLIANSGFEEEKDCGRSSDSSDKEIDLITYNLQVHHTLLCCTECKAIQILVNHYPHANHSQTFTPPPELHPAVI